MEPLAARVAPGERQQLHHFVSHADWDLHFHDVVPWSEAAQMLSGSQVAHIINGIALPKKGNSSIGVAPRYCGVFGE